MQVRSIDISSVNAQLQVSSKSPQINISSNRKSIEIEHQKSNLEMNSQPAKLEIDNTESLASLNIKTVGRVISENAAAGQQSLLETIGRYAEHGDMLMDIRRGSNALYQLAVQKFSVKADRPDIPQLTLPSISCQPNSLNIDYTPAKISINVSDEDPVNISLDRGSVDIKLVQAAQVYIKYTGQPLYSGRTNEMDTQA